MANRVEKLATCSSAEQNATDSLPVRVLKLGLLLLEIIYLTLKAVYLVAKAIFRLVFPIAEKSVNKEIVLITGAAHGIGKELALQYAALGATVICWDIVNKEEQTTVDEIAGLGYPKAYFYQCDVTNEASVAETARRVQKEVGHVSILVNNAGVGYFKPFLQQTHSEVRNTLNVNILSHFWTIQAFLPTMLEKNNGHIVAVSSSSALFGVKHCVPYCASKCAVRGMMESIHQELRLRSDCRIKLTTIFPFFVTTGFTKQASCRCEELLPKYNALYIAKEIISAQRRNIYELSMPRFILQSSSILKLFPISVRNIVNDFIDVNIEN